MKERLHMKPADWGLMLFMVLLAGGLFLAVPKWVLSGGSDVEIQCSDKVVGRYPMNTDRVVEVQGPRGTTYVAIRSGRVHVESSPCPDKLCVKMGEVGTEGGVIVCVPNRIVITAGKGLPDGLDAVSR